MPLASGFAVSRPLFQYTDDEKSSLPPDISSATAYNSRPLNLVQETPGKAPSHFSPSEEPVYITATDISYTEQIVEPFTQEAGILLVCRADDSHLSNSFFSLGSSRPKTYRHPDQSSSLLDHLLGLFPGECHPTQLLQQPVFSPVVQLSSCEIQAGCTNASSIHHTARSPLFSDTCDELPLSVNIFIHMKE